MARRLFERTRRGTFRVRLSPEERDVLRSLPAQLRRLLGDVDDPSLRRLFPPGYEDDPQRDAEFRALTTDALVDHKRAALEVLEATIDASRLDQEQLTAWVTAVNDLRLVLGTRLDVTDDPVTELPEGPDAPAHALYHFLGWVAEEAVDALSGGLDPRGTEG